MIRILVVFIGGLVWLPPALGQADSLRSGDTIQFRVPQMSGGWQKATFLELNSDAGALVVSAGRAQKEMWIVLDQISGLRKLKSVQRNPVAGGVIGSLFGGVLGWSLGYRNLDKACKHDTGIDFCGIGGGRKLNGAIGALFGVLGGGAVGVLTGHRIAVPKWETVDLSFYQAGDQGVGMRATVNVAWAQDK